MAVGFAMIGPRQGQDGSMPPLPGRVGRIVSLAPNITELCAGRALVTGVVDDDATVVVPLAKWWIM